MKAPRPKKKRLSKVQERQQREKAAILEHLQKTPVVQIVCTRAGVGRATYYRWLKEDEEFARSVQVAQEEGIWMVNDMAESVIIKKIQESDMSAAKYWLLHHHPVYRPMKPSPPPPLEDERPFIIHIDR